MSHKQIYYSDKYDDEEFEYRLVPARGHNEVANFDKGGREELVTGAEATGPAHARETPGARAGSAGRLREGRASRRRAGPGSSESDLSWGAGGGGVALVGGGPPLPP